GSVMIRHTTFHIDRRPALRSGFLKQRDSACAGLYRIRAPLLLDVLCWWGADEDRSADNADNMVEEIGLVDVLIRSAFLSVER
ncbi:MAG: hypothetical protein KDA72_02570, partial [Planctomycetales bacterium]|nr:hypothetical protein [Planctomycetales bacterium]